MAEREKEVDTGLRSFWGLILILLCIFCALSLYSYNYNDISFLHARSVESSPDNYIGTVGAWLSFALFVALGLGAYVIPFWLFVFGLILVTNRQERVWPKTIWCTAMAMALTLVPELHDNAFSGAREELNLGSWTSGLLGLLVMKNMLVKWLSPIGAGMLVWSLFLVSLIMTAEPHNIVRATKGIASAFKYVFDAVFSLVSSRQDRSRLIEKEERKLERDRKKHEKSMRKQEQSQSEESKPIKKKKERAEKKKKQDAPEPVAKKIIKRTGAYKLPPVTLLTKADTTGKKIQIDTNTTSRIMIETLSDFGIEVKVTNVETGPVVTRYELLPAPGVRVEKISGLANNLALSLKATSVRVQAPVPGKGVVGIEVPNSSAQIVTERDVLENKQWQPDKLHLPLVLGKDVTGNVTVVDLADMPHLLIAGATGAGKTVCMNSILSGLLMSRTPEEMRLILVDPKIVEFSAFKELPHLVVPVITDPKKVALGLRWAINEMEKRYKLFAKVGVRNIASYNTRETSKQEELANEVQAELAGRKNEPAKPEFPSTVPYIVVVVDELADLMLTNQAEIENCVARLAQLSRAVGIHMILSTQRPSVNVITGTIKANFPARIAFQVAQKVDSRTILDSVGAEKLLGNGDMLYLPPSTSKLVRIQGAMMYDQDIHNIVDFIKAQSGPDYNMDIMEKINKSSSVGSIDTGEDDEMLASAIEVIRETQRASTSSLQRRLRIGYTRAARIMDILEEQGMVGPPRGSDPREILIDLDGNIPNNTSDQPETVDSY